MLCRHIEGELSICKIIQICCSDGLKHLIEKGRGSMKQFKTKAQAKTKMQVRQS